MRNDVSKGKQCWSHIALPLTKALKPCPQPHCGDTCVMLSCKLRFVITSVAVTRGTNDTLIINNLSYADWITWHKQVLLFTLTIWESTVRLITLPVNWGDWADILETVTVCKYIFITSFDLRGQVECVGVVWGHTEKPLWCLEGFVLLKDT